MPKALLINPLPEKMGLEKYFQLPPLSLMQVASLFPENWDVELWDEVHKPLELKNSFDLIGITAMTYQAKRAYEISNFFRNKGIKVILGGMHPSALPEEAINHCDSVLIGEAEPVFENLIKDFEKGNLKKFYKGESKGKELLIPFPKRDILKGKRYITKNVMQITRGCPYNCNFCSITPFFGHKFRQKPLKNVLKEIESLNGKLIVFLDDDLFANINYAKKLLIELKKMKKKWVSQATLRFSQEEEFLKLLKESGCLGLFVGLESVPHPKQVQFLKNKKIKDMEDSLKKIRDLGILIEGSFIFGFDEDDEGVFERTVKFVEKVGLPSATYNILTPYPGSEIFKKFEKEGRLLHKNWEKYNHNEVVFVPKNLTPERLYEGWVYARKETYSLKSIFKRVLKNKHKIKDFAYNILRKIPNDRLQNLRKYNRSC